MAKRSTHRGTDSVAKRGGYSTSTPASKLKSPPKGPAPGAKSAPKGQAK